MHGTLLPGSKHNSIHVRPGKKHRVQRDANIRGRVQDMVTSVPIGLGRDPGSTFALQAALRPGTHMDIFSLSTLPTTATGGPLVRPARLKNSAMPRLS